MKSTCWDTRATDWIIKSGQKDTEASIQVALCEQALIKTNRKSIQNHQSKTLLLFKTVTLEFELDRHMEHIFSYQGMQSGLFVFLICDFGTFVIFLQKNDCLAKHDIL